MYMPVRGPERKERYHGTSLDCAELRVNTAVGDMSRMFQLKSLDRRKCDFQTIHCGRVGLVIYKYFSFELLWCIRQPSHVVA